MKLFITGVKALPAPRICGKRTQLSWPALYPDELDMATTLTFFQAEARARGGVLFEYNVYRELHSNPAGPLKDTHFHAHIALQKGIGILNRLHTAILRP